MYVESVLFVDDPALVAESTEPQQCLVRELGRACELRKLLVNVDKSKVMCVREIVEPSLINTMFNGVRMEFVNSFKYEGSYFSSDGGVRVGEGM